MLFWQKLTNYGQNMTDFLGLRIYSKHKILKNRPLVIPNMEVIIMSLA